MTCWTDMHSWVQAEFPTASADDVARLAVSGMYALASTLGGFKLRSQHRLNSKTLIVDVPDGFRILNVTSIRIPGCCFAKYRDCSGFRCNPPSYSAISNIVTLHDFEPAGQLAEVEISVTLNASEIDCEIDTDMFNMYAPIVAEWCKSRLSSINLPKQSSRRLSMDYLNIFNVMVNQLQREQSQDGNATEFQLKGLSSWL